MFKKVLCNFFLFIKTHQTIYKKLYCVEKTVFKHSFIKNIMEQSQNKRVTNIISKKVMKNYQV